MSVPRILHYPGSKWNMAEWIIEHMPPHQTYLEPFFGSGAVLFNKDPSGLETVNDLDGEVQSCKHRESGLISWNIKWISLHF